MTKIQVDSNGKAITLGGKALEASEGVTPTGTLSITANGVYDVTNYASANVSVAGGDSQSIEVLKYTFVPYSQGTTHAPEEIGNYIYVYDGDVRLYFDSNYNIIGNRGPAFYALPEFCIIYGTTILYNAASIEGYYTLDFDTVNDPGTYQFLSGDGLGSFGLFDFENGILWYKGEYTCCYEESGDTEMITPNYTPQEPA